MTNSISEAIRERALALGFDAVGIADPAAVAAAGEGLDAYLADGRHATMDWMVEKAHWRRDPKALWPDVRSIIMLGMNYGPDVDPLAILDAKDRAAISVYAQGKDYHDIVKKRLKRLGRWLIEQETCEIKVFVDTAPVMEKPLAAAAGIGWQGKHTNLVSREKGSWLFLGAIFTTLDLPYDVPHADRCGSCRACLDACPTGALDGEYRMDARRCISYLTIEHKGPIAPEFRRAMGNRIYGCDDCLAVCPWNHFAERARESAFHAKDHLKSPSLRELVDLNDTAFRAFFSGSPIKRTGRDRLVRNVLIAIGNSGDETFLDVVEERLGDDSAIVRGAAVWAWRELGGAEESLIARSAVECDPSVQSELQEFSS